MKLSLSVAGALVAVLIAVVAVFGASVGPASAATDCDYFAAPSGSDTGTGTSTSDPFRTVGRLNTALNDGDVGCLRAGSYTTGTRLLIDEPNVTLTSYNGESASVQGLLEVGGTATNAKVEALTLDGSAAGQRSPRIGADGASLIGNDISSATDICVLVGTPNGGTRPQGVLIEGNRIHDCGDNLFNCDSDPEDEYCPGHEHGIYVTGAEDLEIRSNWIYDNAASGIQLYPDADDSTIESNVLDGNGSGLDVGGDPGGNRPERNLIRQNVISNSEDHGDDEDRWNVESTGQYLESSTGNQLIDNCLYTTEPGFTSNGGVNVGGTGVTALQIASNVVADPQYVNRAAKNFALTSGSPCSQSALAAPDPWAVGGSPPDCAASFSYVANGTGADNTMNGTNSSDKLDGKAGNDIIRGNAGRDCLIGDTGRDTVRGDEGSDTQRGYEGADTLLGRDGEFPDVLNCGDGAADLARADVADTPQANCETVLYAAP